MQLRARSTKELPDPVQLLEHVYKHQFKLIDPALQQLRRNNIKQYEALYKKENINGRPVSSSEKGAVTKKVEKKDPIVKKGGMFDAHKVAATSTEREIKRGFF